MNTPRVEPMEEDEHHVTTSRLMPQTSVVNVYETTEMAPRVD